MDAQRVEALVAVLLDRGADIGGRDDAAMDLQETDDQRARRALIAVASQPDTPEIVQASAGESLGQIGARAGRLLTDEQRAHLAPVARREYDVFHQDFEGQPSTATADINDV